MCQKDVDLIIIIKKCIIGDCVYLFGFVYFVKYLCDTHEVR